MIRDSSAEKSNLLCKVKLMRTERVNANTNAVDVTTKQWAEDNNMLHKADWNCIAWQMQNKKKS